MRRGAVSWMDTRARALRTAGVRCSRAFHAPRATRDHRPHLRPLEARLCVLLDGKRRAIGVLDLGMKRRALDAWLAGVHGGQAYMEAESWLVARVYALAGA